MDNITSRSCRIHKHKAQRYLTRERNIFHIWLHNSQRITDNESFIGFSRNSPLCCSFCYVELCWWEKLSEKLALHNTQSRNMNICFHSCLSSQFVWIAQLNVYIIFREENQNKKQSKTKSDSKKTIQRGKKKKNYKN